MTPHGHVDPLTHPAFAGVRLLAWRRAYFAVATLPACVRRALRTQRQGWERRQVARRRPGLGPARAYHRTAAHWGRRGRS